MGWRVSVASAPKIEPTPSEGQGARLTKGVTSGVWQLIASTPSAVRPAGGSHVVTARASLAGLLFVTTPIRQDPQNRDMSVELGNGRS
jgi:hypothetical protein